ncbi:MAG: alpha/beta hydrolase [Chitinophagales bacterium]|nr:alpha/beta hydrolase [Chitinophagales bacterium]
MKKELNEQQTQMLSMLAQGLSTPPRTPILRTPEEYGMDYEEITFTTADDVSIKGWFIPANSNKLIISNHFSPANRYGFAGHLEGLDFAGGFEVNFLPRYKALHDAGYNVLAYDLRCHGESEAGEKGVTGVGYFEWQEVLASIDYIKNRSDTAQMDASLLSMCMGANATINAMEKAPEAFEDIKSLIAIAPLKGRTSIERSCEQMQIPVEEGVEAFDPIYNEMTGLHVTDHDIVPKTVNIKIPTFFLQVRNDTNSRWTDVQTMFENTPVKDKKIYYIEDTPWRFKGYTYFSEHPEQMIEWFDAHMK